MTLFNNEKKMKKEKPCNTAPGFMWPCIIPNLKVKQTPKNEGSRSNKASLHCMFKPITTVRKFIMENKMEFIPQSTLHEMSL